MPTSMSVAVRAAHHGVEQNPQGWTARRGAANRNVGAALGL
jgi:hypothetical protein